MKKSLRLVLLCLGILLGILGCSKENVAHIIIKAGETLTEKEKSDVMSAFLAPTGGAAPLVTTF